MENPRTPNRRITRLSHLRDSVKRNLNSSFGESPEKADGQNAPKDRNITLVINQKTQTCRFKNFFYESVSDSDSDNDKKLIVTGKRTTRTPVKYSADFEVSPKKVARHKTPVKKLDKNFEAKTPKITVLRETPGSRIKQIRNEFSTPKTNTPKGTPRSRLKLIREGVITPTMASRGKAVEADTTPLMKARTQLHVSFVPKNLPCREKEYEDVLHFLKGKLFDKCGGCMYISGVPGTGKTATVTAVINYLSQCSKSREVPQFEFVSVNGMKLTEPRQTYVEILKQLSGKTVAWEQAQGMLNDRFTKKSKKTQLPVILLVDELDIICTKRQDVVYNILDWPTKANTQLIVITIANTMDLPERLLMNRVTSRLGLTRLTFQAYTHKQLQEIVTKRLTGTNSFNPDAIQLVARKVASVSGDARRALDICRRAAEMAENEGPDTLVAMSHVNAALKSMITQPKVQAIKYCSSLEQYVLQAVVAEVERTGIEETVFSDVFITLASLIALNGARMVTCSVVLGAVARLSSCRLLLVDQKCSDVDQRIILNVSPDDVYYALKE